MLRMVTLLLGIFVLSYGPALSETYYVAPLGAEIQGAPDGTESLPFSSIDGALKSGKVKGGDTLLLKDGAYGPVAIKVNAVFDVPLTIMSQNAKAAHFDSILLSGSTRNLILRNLSVWPRNPATGADYLVRAYNTSSDITLDGLDIRSGEDAGNYMSWDATTWESRKYSGILLQSPRSRVINSKLTGIRHGILVEDDSQIINNIVAGYNGDGLRAFSRSIVRGNRVIDCVKTDTNHPDGFQSFSRNEVPVTDLLIDSNVIIEWTGAASHPVRCSLQGIGLFRGFYDNLVIVNNLVVTSHYHGISVYGARGAKLLNNTVVNIYGLAEVRPYIAIYPLKDGTLPTGVLVANNIAMSIQGKASPEVKFLNNSVIGLPSLVFENPAAFDYRPKVSSGFIDTGDATVAPATDVMGLKRPSGPLPDRGAYEVQADVAPAPAPVEPVVEPAPVEPNVIAPSPTVPKRIKVKTDDPRKNAPVSRRLSPTSNIAKRIILER